MSAPHHEEITILNGILFLFKLFMLIFAIGLLIIALFVNFSPMIWVLVGIGVAIYVMFKYPVFSALVGLSFLIGES